MICERVLVVGLGSIGRRHVRNLAALYPGVRLAAWRRDRVPTGDAEVDSVLERVVVSAREAAEWAPQAAVIANPAPMHVEAARALLDLGCHLLIEKPLSDGLAGIDALLEDARQRGRVVMVAYHLRFHPKLQAIKAALDAGEIGRPLSLRAEVGQYLPDWRPGTDYRRGVSARRELGGGALLELSHELDYARWLLGEVRSVSAHVDRLSDLEMDVEDTAEIVLRFASGALGSVHVDMVQRAPTRTCRVIGTDGTLEWDALGDRARLYRASTREWTDLPAPLMPDRNGMYLAELEEFFDSAAEGRLPRVTGEDGRRVVEMALAARRSAETGCVVQL